MHTHWRTTSPTWRRGVALILALLAMLLTFAPGAARAANLTVTSTADSGADSLRQAIADAASGDTITFNLPNPSTITLASQLVIDKNLTITGPGASQLSISGNNTVRIFQVSAGATLNLSGVTLANGSSPGIESGGAINNSGTLTVSNSTFTNNKTARFGGAILNLSGTLTVSGSTFTNNTANLSGAIDTNYGTATITNSTFTNNSANEAGVMENFEGTVTITGSTFTNNHSARDAGAIENFQGTLTVSNSTFSGNTAASDGGALYNFDSSTMTVTGSTFTGNTASEGGGIYNLFGDLSLRNNSFVGNRPGGNCGGGIDLSSDKGGNRSDDQTCDFFSVPNDIRLNPPSVAEERPAGTTVGTLSTEAAGGTYTYTLVSGAGDTDNASFTISGNLLKTAAIFDYETKNSYSIRVQLTDDLGVTVVKNFTISVTDVVENHAPTAITLDPSVVAENQPAGTAVGTFSTTDPDTGDSFTYSLVGGAGSTDNGSFTISGNTLKTAASFDYETKNSYSIRVRSTDSGGLFTEQVFTISVSDVNENVAPVATNDSFSTNEDTALNGNVLANDTDANNDTLTAIKLSDPQHGSVTLNSDGSFTYTPAANYNGTDSFSYKANDGQLDSNVATVSITVNSVNDAPAIAVVAGGACLSDTSGQARLALADVDSPLTSLKLSVASSNTALVPLKNIALSGTGASRTATITTVSGKTGTAVVTFTVSDGPLASSVTVTVQAGGNGENRLNGTDGADMLFGQNGEDTLNGKGGVDLLCGGRGEDRLIGGTGADRFDGGQGEDTAADFNAAEGDTKVNVP